MLTTIAVALITAVFGPIMVNWVKLKMEKPDKRTPMREALETSTLIDGQLEAIMNELNCDRVWLAQFHNGGHFYPTGKSIQKFSVFYEVLTPGTPSLKTTFQNILHVLCLNVCGVFYGLFLNLLNICFWCF